MTKISDTDSAADKKQVGSPSTSAAGARSPINGDLLGMPGIKDIELEIPRQRDLGRAADFT